MSLIKIGCYGVNGHQILALAPILKNASISAISGITDAQFEMIKKDQTHPVDTLQRYPDLNGLLEDSQIDMISICSPRRDHQAEDIIKSLNAGKHVYGEKPLALTLEDLDRIREAVKRSGKELRAMTGSCYSPCFTAIKEVVDGGEIGEIVQVYAQKSYPYCDDRPQDRGFDGGLIMQAGIHAISFIRWATGLDFRTVSAFDTMLGNPREGELQMAAVVNFVLSNGALGVANFNYLNPSGSTRWGDDRLRVYGTKGMAESLAGATLACVTTNNSDTRELNVPKENYVAHVQAFIDLLTGGTPMRVSIEDSLMETEVVINAQLSADEQGVVRTIGSMVECNDEG